MNIAKLYAHTALMRAEAKPKYPPKDPSAFAADGGPNAPQPEPADLCHRCNGMGEIVRYRMDGSVKSRQNCPCREPSR